MSIRQLLNYLKCSLEEKLLLFRKKTPFLKIGYSSVCAPCHLTRRKLPGFDFTLLQFHGLLSMQGALVYKGVLGLFDCSYDTIMGRA